MSPTPEERIRSLGIWQGSIEIEPLSGGMTNRNYTVYDQNRKLAVRLGDDIDVHMISRANELQASIAAFEAGISPRVVHHAPGLLVMDFIEGRALSEADVNRPEMIKRIVPLIRTCHSEVPKYFRGPTYIFWVFQVIRQYGRTLLEAEEADIRDIRHLMQIAERLEKAAGPQMIVFGHNDLLASNILDDGERLWLIDWDYAGFNSPLFDLGGLASNNGLSEEREVALLELYFEARVDEGLYRRYRAMKCASLLRETMWSMVSQIHSTIQFDYAAYTAENRSRFDTALAHFDRI